MSDDNMTPLMRAAKRGDVEKIKEILANEYAINVKDEHGRTALMYAAQSGNADAVKALLDAGVKVDVKDEHDRTALMYAAQSGNADAVKALLDAGADIDAKDFAGQSLMNFAFMGNDTETIKVLITEMGDFTGEKGVGALSSAAFHENVEVAEALIAAGADVHAKDGHDRTVLMSAARAGNVNMVRFLLDKKVDINAKSDKGETALMAATESGNADVVKALIEAGAEIEARDEDDFTALMCAARSGNADVVKVLIDKKADVNAVSQEGYTALMLAAYNDNTDAVKMLIDKGANVNAKDEDGWTALMGAVESGNIEAAKLLLNAKADINIKDKDGKTALDYVPEGNEEMRKLLEEAQKGKLGKVSTKGASSQSQTGNTKSSKTVNSSAMSDRMDNWLKQVNLDPSLKEDLVQKYGEELAYKLIQQCMQSPGNAMKAMGEGWKNSKNAIEYFANLDLGEEGAIDKLAAAAKMNASAVKDSLTNSADEKGTTPLMYAAERGNVGAVEVLVDLGAGVDTKDACGCTALIWAAYNGQAEAVKALIVAKADVNVHDEYYGGTALIYAARSGNTEAVEALIVAGADVNAVDSSNQTALMFAAAKGHTEAVKALIAAKADVNVVSIDGCIALNEAVNSGNIEAVKLLLDAGADISIEDKDGKTALDYVPEGNEEMRKLLEEAKKKQAENVSAKGVTNDEQQQPNSERDAIRAGFKKMNKEQWDALVNDYLTGSATLETDPSKGLKVDLMLERVFAGLRFEETLRSLFKDNENVDCKTSMKRSAELLGQYLQSDASDKSFEGFISFVDKAYATQETPSQTNTQARSTQRKPIPKRPPIGNTHQQMLDFMEWQLKYGCVIGRMGRSWG